MASRLAFGKRVGIFCMPKNSGQRDLFEAAPINGPHFHLHYCPKCQGDGAYRCYWAGCPDRGRERWCAKHRFDSQANALG